MSPVAPSTPPNIVAAVEQFANRVGLSDVQRDALNTIVRVTFDSGFAHGRVSGAEGLAAVMRGAR